MPATPLVKTPSKKQRLEHVDAMRPLKQFGVVSNHVLLFFAPVLSVTAGSLEMLLHVTREAFLFISACMLTYAYAEIKRRDYGRFYKRRAISVLLPYLCWTLIYYLLTLHSGGFAPRSAIIHLLYLAGTGYYQLYYLVVIMEFYLVFPLIMPLIKKANRHWLILGISGAIQILYVSLMHWNMLPMFLQGFWANREIVSYQFYLVAGMLAALHFEQFHDWILAHRKMIISFTLGSTALAEVWYLCALHARFSWMGANSDPFQPIIMPFNIGAILCIYLAGVYLVSSDRPKLLRAMVRSGSENSYGVYVAQMLFISAIFNIGWLNWTHSIPWGLTCILEIIIVFAGSMGLTAILARTPLSTLLTGRQRQSWSSLKPDFRVYMNIKNPDRVAAEEIS